MLAENFPDLEKLYGQGALSGYLGGQQIDAARKSQQINQQSALQEMFWKDQTMPADIGYKKALTGQTEETARGQRFKNDFNDSYKDDVYKKELARIAKETKEDDLKAAEASINDMALNLGPGSDPNLVKTIDFLRSQFKDVWAEREKQKYMLDRQAALEEQRGKNQQAAAAARAARTGSVSALDKAMVSGDPYQVAAAYDKMAQSTDDPEERAFYVQKSQEYRMMGMQRDAARNPGTAPGQINRGEMGIPVNPAFPPAQPPIQRGASGAAPKKAPTNAQEAQAAGWKIMTDKNGKKAYVSPDKTQFFEVQ